MRSPPGGDPTVSSTAAPVWIGPVTAGYRSVQPWAMLRRMKTEAPLSIHAETVRPEWIDYNGHMNVAYYALIFDHATDALLDLLDLGEAYMERDNLSLFAVDSRVVFLRELDEGTCVRCTTQLLDFDEKRLHVCHEMRHAEEGWTAAFCEWVLVHVDLGARRTAPIPEPALDRLARLKARHEGLPRPAVLGRAIGLRRTRE